MGDEKGDFNGDDGGVKKGAFEEGEEGFDRAGDEGTEECEVESGAINKKHVVHYYLLLKKFIVKTSRLHSGSFSTILMLKFDVLYVY